MKKNFLLILTALTVLSLTACTAAADTSPRVMQPITLTDTSAQANSQNQPNAAAVPVETPALDATPEPLPKAGDSVVFATPAPVQDLTPMDDEISAEDAKVIALTHAGLTEDQVTYVRVHHDWDDGCAEYEIEFYCGDREYDYDIDACTGTIRSFDTELEHHSSHHTQQSDSHHNDGHHGSTATPTPAPQSAVLSKEEVRKIALEHAGVSAEEAVFEKVKLETENGRQEYEIEFRVGRTEYEYEIDAQTGAIRDWDKDSDD